MGKIHAAILSWAEARTVHIPGHTTRFAEAWDDFRLWPGLDREVTHSQFSWGLYETCRIVTGGVRARLYSGGPEWLERPVDGLKLLYRYPAVFSDTRRFPEPEYRELPGGYGKYTWYITRSAKWRQYTANTTLRVRCLDCGSPADQTHHVGYARLYVEELGAAVPLCRRCHDQRHRSGREPFP